MKKKGKYLFFDIECSNGYNICSFGYALISDDLRVVEKKDIIINPESKFILSPKGMQAKISLAYPEETFYKQDNFTFFYDDIKKLLCNKKLTLVGHSVLSDLHFLDFACKRYKLPKLNIAVYDMQKIFQISHNRPHVESLEGILCQLEIDISRLTLHRSCDDALATFYVARAICEEKNCTIEQLLEEYKQFKIKI